MRQLLEITSVPIEIEMRTSRAQLQYTRGTAELEVSRDKGGLSIKSRPIQLNMDTFEMRQSIVPTAPRSIEQSAQKGQQAAYSATAALAQEGELYLKAKIGEDVQAQLAKTTMEHLGVLSAMEAQLSASTPQSTARYQAIVDTYTMGAIRRLAGGGDDFGYYSNHQKT